MAKKAEAQEAVEKFVRLVDVTRPTDQVPAWQPEILFVQGNKITKRELASKPDTWPMAFSVAQDLIDPKAGL